MPTKQPTAGIILAAGMSTRFKSPKQLIRWSGKCMVEHVLDSAVASDLDRVFLVLGFGYPVILETIQSHGFHPKIEIVRNPDYARGLSTSVKTGLSRVKDLYPSVMFLLADQPLVDAAFINALLHGFWKSDKGIGIPVHHGCPGNPTLFSRRFYPALMAITGDDGGRHIIKGNPADVWILDVEQPRSFLDIDTEEDFLKLNLSI